MSFDDITIGDAKRLAAMFATPAQPTTTTIQYPVGRVVLVRANRAGVWAGTLESAVGDRLRLVGARRLWSWTGALECSVLAVRGPSSAKAGDPTTVILGQSAEVIEVHEMSDEAWRIVCGIAPWSR